MSALLTGDERDQAWMSNWGTGMSYDQKLCLAQAQHLLDYLEEPCTCSHTDKKVVPKRLCGFCMEQIRKEINSVEARG